MLLNSKYSQNVKSKKSIFNLSFFSFFFPSPSDDLQPWMKWAYYISPMSYGQNAIVMNEFLDKRWSTVSALNSLSMRCHVFCNMHSIFDLLLHFNGTKNPSSESWIFSGCSLIQIPVSMNLLLEKSSSSRGASIQMTTGFGFALVHSYAFLFSSTFYL